MRNTLALCQIYADGGTPERGRLPLGNLSHRQWAKLRHLFRGVGLFLGVSLFEGVVLFVSEVVLGRAFFGRCLSFFLGDGVDSAWQGSFTRT